MYSLNNIAILVFLSIFGTISIVSGAENVTKKEPGVCYLEVPTIDLLSDDQKLNQDYLKGNGSRPGYTKIQTCCIGYKLQDHTAFHCVPDCPDGCLNGNCTSPGVCECRKGFVLGPKGTCVEVCPKGCYNGVCVANGTCNCNPGYSLDPKHLFCIPQCANGCGSGGECVAPNKCECQKGFYQNKNGKCEFFCDGGCSGGECIGPNQCSCKTGFEKLNGACAPKCTKGCKNGDCISPDVCRCKSGWKLDKSGSICEATCDQPCLNGVCSGPNECSCNSGYTKDPKEPKGYRCVAYCPEGCPNGVCSSPNFCICNPGYIKQGKGSNICIKRTRRHSFHPELIPEQMFSVKSTSFNMKYTILIFFFGSLISVNSLSGKGVCKFEVPTIQLISQEQKHLVDSFKGNGSTPSHSTIEVCCSGYKLDCNSQRCLPECAQGCENGECTAPNTCTCKHGFIKGPKDKCIRVCPWGCLNGVCANDGRCSCNSGYTMHINGMYCLPTCIGGCGKGGECVAPNQCQCLNGYYKDYQGKCIPSLSQYQPHQQQIYNQTNQMNPNTQNRSCQGGHQLINGECKPICSKGCQNGVCLAPERCSCNPGWILDLSGSICTPHCNPACINGDCTGANQCSCKNGYINDPTRSYMCIAHCPGGCPNGVCSGPNFCICKPGYVKRGRGSNECVPGYSG
ncbi:multiple epidermal growth factor-like domains protein 10 [Onthophagus taurus]|uniref:multiple epidermal growth factor-like domains protein 10 n=1 Tax=Onthophagus taurus TaxID=166361 RepID=UPI0039BDFC7A